MLHGKKILLGVCGSIAAYKSALLVRLLIKEGAEVKVILTASASSFITPLTLSTLSRNPVLTGFSKNDSGEWNNHVELGLWADLLVIAPASANTIAKCSNGICDNLLTAVYLSARCPVLFAPAMDLDMYVHPSVTGNLQKLKQYGNFIIDAEYGELASGLIGSGRMAEPEQLVVRIKALLHTDKGVLAGKNVLITAGPTYEAIDPVRFIGNRSSGKMGYAIAEICRDKGAVVTLVSGPVSLPAPQGVNRILVESAEEMFAECIRNFPDAHITVLSAAVADYRPESVHTEKIKKGNSPLELRLTKTRDIAAELGRQKKEGQVIAGFALETENEIENAREKLSRKNFDLIVLNSLRDPGAGFATDTNKISILTKDNKFLSFELKSKKEVAQDILEAIENLIR
jgi:phosphopantothenoylcysteine decarboxylase / phosphopantothenate---cysteine ligase